MSRKSREPQACGIHHFWDTIQYSTLELNSDFAGRFSEVWLPGGSIWIGVVFVDRARRTPLHYAAMADDPDEDRRLVAVGAEPNAEDASGFMPLHLAAQEFALAAAQVLLERGARVDAQNAYGNSPLFVAVFNSDGRGDFITLLRSWGADPLLVNRSGQTPAGLAGLIGNYDVAQYFTDIDDG